MVWQELWATVARGITRSLGVFCECLWTIDTLYDIWVGLDDGQGQGSPDNRDETSRYHDMPLHRIKGKAV